LLALGASHRKGLLMRMFARMWRRKGEVLARGLPVRWTLSLEFECRGDAWPDYVSEEMAVVGPHKSGHLPARTGHKRCAFRGHPAPTGDTCKRFMTETTPNL